MKSPMEIVKLLIAEEMSLAVNSSILESIFEMFLDIVSFLPIYFINFLYLIIISNLY